MLSCYIGYSLFMWPTEQDESDTKSDSIRPSKTKAIQGKNGKKADVNETQYNFTIINTETEYYKYTLSKQLEELDVSKRYNGKYLYYIKQIIFLFYRNDKVIVPFKLLAKKRIK